MRKNLAAALLIVLLVLLHFQLNATTSRRLIAAMRAEQMPIFFAEASPSGSSQTQTSRTQTQTQTQKRPQSQSQTQSQPQSQTQKLYIGFPMIEGWTFHTGAPLIAQPQTDPTSVYCASKAGVISSLNQEDGKQIWRANVSDTIEEAFLLNENTLYIGTQRGFLFALDKKTGKQLWSESVDGESFVTRPAIDDASVYFQGAHGTVVSMNQKTGKLIWKFRAGGESATSPFVKNGMLFLGCDDHQIYALDSKAGFLKWKYNTNAAVKGSPIASSQYVFAGNELGLFYCLRIENGTEKWKVKTGGAIRSVPAFYYHKDEVEPSEVLFSAFDAFLYDLKIKNGGRAWLASTASRVYNRMFFDRALFFVAPFGSVIFGYDPHTGARVGDFNTKIRVRSSPITANDRLFIGLNNGELLTLTRQPPPPPENEETQPSTQSQTQTQAQSQTQKH